MLVCTAQSNESYMFCCSFFFLECGYGGMSGSGSVETVSHYTFYSLVLGIIGGRCQCKLRCMEGRVGADRFCEGSGGRG